MGGIQMMENNGWSKEETISFIKRMLEELIEETEQCAEKYKHSRERLNGEISGLKSALIIVKALEQNDESNI